MCKIEGCARESMYKKRDICQMHYFRYMRHGKYELDARTRKYRISNPAGYQKISAPDHPLADSTGYVYEHRAVLFAEYAWDLSACALCGRDITWHTCHVDHIDADVTNNNPKNLRPTCNTCNTRRNRKPEWMYGDRTILEFNGEKNTAHGWSKDPRVSVSRPTIMRRTAMGYTDFDALFAPKLTHNGHK